MLAVLLFMPPVPRRAISPKQTPGPRVTKMMLSLGPPTTLSNDKTELQNHKSTNAHLDKDKDKCSPGPLLRTRWTSPSRRRPSCRCSPRARRWSASTCTRSSGDRASFEEENTKKGRNIFWSGMAKELWPLWTALTTPELLDQHLASTTLLFCKPHSTR